MSGEDSKRLDSIILGLRKDKSPLVSLETALETLAQIDPSNPRTQHFIVDFIPKLVPLILSRGDFDERCFSTANEVLRQVVLLALKFVDADIVQLQHACLIILADNEKAYYKGSAQLAGSEKSPSLYEQNVSFFLSKKGLEKILARIQNLDLKMSPTCLRMHLDLIFRLNLNPSQREYWDELKRAVFDFLRSLGDDPKALGKDDMGAILGLLTEISLDTSDDHFSEEVRFFKLNTALRKFKSPSLEKRLTGLSEIRTIAIEADKMFSEGPAEMETGSDPEIPSLSPDVVVKWIADNQILEYLFGPSIHLEVLRRSLDILKFLVRHKAITRPSIDTIWKACEGSQHRSVVHGVFNIFGDLCQFLPHEILEYAFQKVKQIPEDQMDSQTLLFIQKFTFAAVNSSKIIMTDESTMVPLYGAEILWNLLRDDSPLSTDLANQAHIYLSQFIVFSPCASHRVHFARVCVERIEKHDSAPYSLQLLQKIINSGFLNETDKAKVLRHQQENFKKLAAQYDILGLLLQDLAHYKTSLASIVSNFQAKHTHKTHDWNTSVVIGKHNHLEHIRARLDFFTFLVEITEEGFLLAPPIWDQLWEQVIEKSVTVEERDVAFGWFQNLSNSKLDSLIPYLFTSKILSLDASILTPQGFSFVRQFFLHMSWGEKKLYMNQEKVVIQSVDLEGVEIFWRISIYAQDLAISKEASAFLISLYLNLGPEVSNLKKQQRENFIDRCMAELAGLRALEQSPQQIFRLTRCLSVLKEFLDSFALKFPFEIQKAGARSKSGPIGDPITLSIKVLEGATFDLESHWNATIGEIKEKICERANFASPSAFRVIAAGKDLTPLMNGKSIKELNFINRQTLNVVKRPSPLPDDQGDASETPQVVLERLPSTIISQRYFDPLFQLLELHDDVAQKVWEILMMLPTNANMANILKELVETGSSSWRLLLDGRNTFQLLYCLQIVENLVKEQTPEAVAWSAFFRQKQGFQHLWEILLNEDFLDQKKGILRKSCLALLLKLTSLFLASAPLSDLISSEARATMVNKLAGIILQTVSFSTFLEEDVQIVRNGLVLLFSCAAPTGPSPEQNAGFTALCNLPNLHDWLVRLLISGGSPPLREEASKLLLKFCQQLSPVSPPGGESSPLLYFFKLLLNLIPVTEIHFLNTAEFFNLIQALTKFYLETTTQSSFNPSALALEVYRWLMAHPIHETHSKPEVDSTLIGLLGLLMTLLPFAPGMKITLGKENFVRVLFLRFLFEIESGKPESSLPVCKKEASRKAAFALLLQLCATCPENFGELMRLCLHFHQPETEQQRQWSYSPQLLERVPSGYVGLKNLGATCYMNSITQQFFMIPAFRAAILSAQDKEPDKENSLLHQLQTLFVYLQESQKKAYDTTPFCLSFKDYEGKPMNINLQMDVDEYFNMLFDRLENLLKGTEAEKTLFKKVFCGKIAQQIKSQECPHVSEREESFFALQCEVKGKKNVQDSLQTYVKGEVLDGDNKYFCETCSKNVNAIKRACVKQLPETLIFHLKRFDFDMETLRRLKINDYYEFPTLIDMEPYTKEYITRMEAAAANGEAPPSRSHSPTPVEASSAMEEDDKRSEYLYQLVGILVHTGTADSGHYYSFIKERVPRFDGRGEPQWFQFNDSNIEPFNPADITAECFGGTELATNWDAGQMKNVSKWQTKPYSAYMLLYERVAKSREEDRGALALATSCLSSPGITPIVRGIRESNEEFLRDRLVFDEAYFAFLSDLLRAQWDLASQELRDQPASAAAASGAPGPLAPGQRLTQENIEGIVQLATLIFIHILSHSKDRGPFQQWVGFLKTLFEGRVPACQWFLHSALEGGWIKQLLLNCYVKEVQAAFAEVLMFVVTTLRPLELPQYSQLARRPPKRQGDRAQETRKLRRIQEDDDSGEDESTGSEPGSEEEPGREEEEEGDGVQASRPTLIVRLIQHLLELLDEAHLYWRHFESFFAVALWIAQLGWEERGLFINHGGVARLVAFFLGEDVPRHLLPVEAAGKRKRKRKMGDKFNVPPLQDYLQLVTLLVTSVNFCRKSPELPPTLLPGPELSLPPFDSSMLWCSSETRTTPTGETIHPERHVFFARQLKENVNAEASITLFKHLAWDNHKLSPHLVRVIISGIDDLPPEYFEPYFKVLSALLDLDDPISTDRSQYIASEFIGVVGENIQYPKATNECVRFLASKIAFNRDLMLEVARRAKEWVPLLFFKSESDKVHEAAFLLISDILDSEEPKLMSFFFTQLLKLLPAALEQARGNYEVPSLMEKYNGKLAHYFRSLSLCITPDTKKQFSEFLDDFMELYEVLDGVQHASDENKKELMLFLARVVEDCPQTIQRIVSSDFVSSRIIECFVSLSHESQFSRAFNSSYLPSFYRLLLHLATNSAEFASLLLGHHNLKWALQNMYLKNLFYPEIHQELDRLFQFSADKSSTFRLQYLEMALNSNLTETQALSKLFKVLLQEEEDALSFIELGGLNYCTSILLNHYNSAYDEDLELVEALLKTLLNVLGFFVQFNNLSEERDFLAEKWKNQPALVMMLFTFMNTNAPTALRSLAIELTTSIFSFPAFRSSVHAPIKAILQEHEVWLTKADENRITNEDLKSIFFGAFSPFSSLEAIGEDHDMGVAEATRPSSTPKIHVHSPLLLSLPSDQSQLVIETFYTPYLKMVATLACAAAREADLRQDALHVASLISIEALPTSWPGIFDLWIGILFREKPEDLRVPEAVQKLHEDSKAWLASHPTIPVYITRMLETQARSVLLQNQVFRDLWKLMVSQVNPAGAEAFTKLWDSNLQHFRESLHLFEQTVNSMESLHIPEPMQAGLENLLLKISESLYALDVLLSKNQQQEAEPLLKNLVGSKNLELLQKKEGDHLQRLSIPALLNVANGILQQITNP